MPIPSACPLETQSIHCPFWKQWQEVHREPDKIIFTAYVQQSSRESFTIKAACHDDRCQPSYSKNLIPSLKPKITLLF